ncbi:hypothetical protein KAJ83_12505 [Marivibrio halodurans]|uniref:Uncharacterized protein n=1 Tax=Marivibrio halodurans TaxID=2039722 RepID=A0A8J7S3D5_9PROT|nr:hypothetical protein [Marivibrio halodurans]MBP5857833.1 hypothetical protein [Marivibrio halodurans]
MRDTRAITICLLSGALLLLAGLAFGANQFVLDKQPMEAETPPKTETMKKI